MQLALMYRDLTTFRFFAAPWRLGWFRHVFCYACLRKNMNCISNVSEDVASPLILDLFCLRCVVAWLIWLNYAIRKLV